MRTNAGLPELHSRWQKGLSPPFVTDITTFPVISVENRFPEF